jgi:hypothetical protein
MPGYNSFRGRIRCRPAASWFNENKIAGVKKHK